MPQPPTTPPLGTQQVMSHAAALLWNATRSTYPLDDGPTLRCLSAIEALIRAGAHAEPPPRVDTRPVELIERALQMLASLPIEVFDNDLILAASAHARRAVRESG